MSNRFDALLGAHHVFAVTVRTSELNDDVMFRVLIDKLEEMAKNEPGFLASYSTFDEFCEFSCYFNSKLSALRWYELPMLNRTLSIANQCWFDSYHIAIVQVESHEVHRVNNPARAQTRFETITTPRGKLCLLNVEQASLLQDYVVRNRAHLLPWEPERNEDFYGIEVSRMRIREMRRDFTNDKGLVLCLLDPDETRILAYSSFSRFHRGVAQSCELGYSVSADLQGQGFMRECLEAGIQFVTTQLNIRRIEACYLPRNERSAAMLRSLGFQKEGLARNYLKINGVWEDHVLTALLR